MEKEIQKIKEYAKENNVPILRDKTLEILLDLIREMVKENTNENDKDKDIDRINILEIGTAIAYTTLQMANIDGNIYVDTIERKPEVAENAKSNIKKISDRINGTDNSKPNIGERINLYQGDAIEVLKEISRSGNTYDLIFIDANKSKYLEYFNITKELLKKDKTTYIFADNVLYMGYVLGGYNEKKHRTAVVHLREFISEIMTNKYDTKLYSIDDGFSVTKFEKN